jgi:hypothetical protein
MGSLNDVFSETKDKILSESPTLFSPQNRAVASLWKKSQNTWGDQRTAYTSHFCSYWEEKKSGVGPMLTRFMKNHCIKSSRTLVKN